MCVIQYFNESKVLVCLKDTLSTTESVPERIDSYIQHKICLCLLLNTLQ